MAGAEARAGTGGLLVALLAAGRSSRFGMADKLAADLGGRPLVEWAALAGRAVVAPAHIVVTGPATAIDLAALGYARVVNPASREGLGTSLACAARHASALDAAALLVLLGDMPFVDGAHLASLVEAHRRDPARPVFSRAGTGRMQPPAIFPAALFPALARLTGDRGAQALAQGAAFVEAPEVMLADIDTPADLDRLRPRGG